MLLDDLGLGKGHEGVEGPMNRETLEYMGALVAPIVKVVADLAESDPIYSSDWGDFCHHCEEPIGTHKDGCLWVRARRIMTDGLTLPPEGPA